MGTLLTVRIPDDVFDLLTSQAGPRGRSAMVTQALRAHLVSAKPKPVRVAKPLPSRVWDEESAYVAWGEFNTTRSPESKAKLAGWLKLLGAPMAGLALDRFKARALEDQI